MTLGLNWLRKKRDAWIFLGGFVIGSVFEYICSWVQEFLFGTVSWQYDEMPFNLNGRINLLYSIFWGVLALLWVKGIYPWMCRLVNRIPNKIGKPLTWVLLVFMILNSAISGLAVARMSARYAGEPATNALNNFWMTIIPMSVSKKFIPIWFMLQKTRASRSSPYVKAVRPYLTVPLLCITNLFSKLGRTLGQHLQQKLRLLYSSQHRWSRRNSESQVRRRP